MSAVVVDGAWSSRLRSPRDVFIIASSGTEGTSVLLNKYGLYLCHESRTLPLVTNYAIRDSGPESELPLESYTNVYSVGSGVLVATTLTSIYVLGISNSDLLKFASHGSESIPDIYTTEIDFQQDISMESKHIVDSCPSLNGDGVISAFDNGTLQFICVTGDHMDSIAITPARPELADARITNVLLCDIYGHLVLFCVYSDGVIAAWIIPDSDPHSWFERHCDDSIAPDTLVHVQGPVTAVAYNPTLKCLALGLLSSDIILIPFSIIEEALISGEGFPLSLPGFDISTGGLGGVSSLSWEFNTNSLAVGFTKRGFCIFTSSGCLVFSTLPRSQDNPGSPSITEMFASGVSSVSWASSGYALLVSGSVDPESEPESNVVRFGVLRSYDLLLIGEHRLLQWHGRKWYPISLPKAYLKYAFPISFATQSSSGHQIAIAGNVGIGLYNSLLSKWRVFGNSGQEMDIRASALAWFGEFIIVIANFDGVLYFYPRTHLDHKSLLHSHSIGGKSSTTILALDICGDLMGIIAKHDDKYTVELYELHCQLKSKSKTYPSASVKSGDVVPSNTKIGVRRIWKITLPDAIGIRPRIRVWRGIGPLSCLIHMKDGLYRVASAALERLTENIDNFWTNTSGLMATYGNLHGLEMWFPSKTGETEPQLPREVVAAYEEGNIPVRSMNSGSFCSETTFEFAKSIVICGVAWDDNTVVGTSTGLGPTRADPDVILNAGPKYVIQERLQPFLDAVIRHYVTRAVYDHDFLFKLVNSFSSRPNFSLSLELALHTVMDVDVVVKRTLTTRPSGIAGAEVGSPSLDMWMPRIIGLLRRFQVYRNVIASCARKTDFTHWGRLFPLAGTPDDLFIESVTAGELEVAASYLMILQRANGSYLAHKRGLQLFQLLKNHDIKPQLMMELARFLQMSAERNRSNSAKGFELQRVNSMDSNPDGKLESPPSYSFWNWFGF